MTSISLHVVLNEGGLEGKDSLPGVHQDIRGAELDQLLTRLVNQSEHYLFTFKQFSCSPLEVFQD